MLLGLVYIIILEQVLDRLYCSYILATRASHATNTQVVGISLIIDVSYLEQKAR